MKNEQLIPASAAVVLTMGTLAEIQRKESMPGAPFWIGIGVAYFVISIVDQINHDLGAGLGLLVMVSATMEYGTDVAKLLGSRTGGQIGTKTKAKDQMLVRGPRLNAPTAPTMRLS